MPEPATMAAAAQEISIMVCGFAESVPQGTSLHELVQLHQAQHKDLVVELGGRFVHPQDYHATILQEGDRVEMIHMAFGG